MLNSLSADDCYQYNSIELFKLVWGTVYFYPRSILGFPCQGCAGLNCWCLLSQLTAAARSWPTARRTLSQFLSFRIRGTKFLNYIIFANLLILRLSYCENARRVCASKSARPNILQFQSLKIYPSWILCCSETLLGSEIAKYVRSGKRS